MVCDIFAAHGFFVGCSSIRSYRRQTVHEYSFARTQRATLWRELATIILTSPTRPSDAAPFPHAEADSQRCVIHGDHFVHQ